MDPRQCRAARALLGWTQDNLAEAAEVGVMTVRSFENGKATPRRASLKAIQTALTDAGVEFTNSDERGVKFKSSKDS